jgi:Zn-dependent protease with chaperone function
VENNLYLLILLLEWVLLVTIAAPMFFTGRFRKTPTLGIYLWLASLMSSILATVAAVVLASYSVFATYQNLRAEDELGFVLVASFAPWVLLGLAGVLIAVGNQRLAPLFEVTPELGDLEGLGGRYIMQYHRARIVELEIPGYFALTRKRTIYLSMAVFELPSKQLDAILRHEYGHIKLRHGLIKKLAYLIYQLLPWVVASRALKREVDVLCELAADKYALKKVYSKDLSEARRLFV